MAIVLHNQSLLDFAIQHTGNVTNAFEIAIANGISISDDISSGSTLIIPDSVVMDVDIRNYYQSKAIQPATAITTSVIDGEPETQLEGISYWAIYDDFIVQ